MDGQIDKNSNTKSPRKKILWVTIIGITLIALAVCAYVLFFSNTGADSVPRNVELNRASCPKIVPYPGGDYNIFVTWCQNSENNLNKNQSCVVSGGANPNDKSQRSWACVTDEIITPETDNTPDTATPIAGEIPPQQQDQSPTQTPETSCNSKSTSSVTWHYDPSTGACTIVPDNTKTPAAKETPYEKFVRECQAKGTGYYFSGDPNDSSTWQCLKDKTVANKKPCGGDATKLQKCKEVCESKKMKCAENEFCGCRKPTPKENWDDWWKNLSQQAKDAWEDFMKSMGIEWT